MRKRKRIFFFSKNWIQRTTSLHHFVRKRISGALESLNPKYGSVGDDDRNPDPRVSAGKIIDDFEKQILTLAGGSRVEADAIKAASVADFVRTFENYCLTIKKS